MSFYDNKSFPPSSVSGMAILILETFRDFGVDDESLTFCDDRIDFFLSGARKEIDAPYPVYPRNPLAYNDAWEFAKFLDGADHVAFGHLWQVFGEDVINDAVNECERFREFECGRFQ